MLKLTPFALLALGAQALLPGVESTNDSAPKNDETNDTQIVDDSEDRVDASTEIVGNSSTETSTLDGANAKDGKTLNIKAIVRLYEASKTLYDEVMKKYLDGVYDNYNVDGEPGLDSEEALEYFYDVLDVTRQHDGLSIAKAAAEIASGKDDDVIDKSEMENFLYKLFTGDYSERIYSKTDLGINIDLETYNKA